MHTKRFNTVGAIPRHVASLHVNVYYREIAINQRLESAILKRNVIVEVSILNLSYVLVLIMALEDLVKFFILS